MTVKDLAYFTDKNKSTVGRWVPKCKSESAKYKLQNATRDRPADFDPDEIESILNASSMSKDAVMIIMENARRTPTIGKSPSVDYEAIGKMIGIAVTAALAPILEKISSPIAKEERKPKMISAPEQDFRSMLNQIVRKHATKFNDGKVQESWGMLYEELYYRCHVSIRTRANNSGRSKLDEIERADLLESSYFIMIEKMGE